MSRLESLVVIRHGQSAYNELREKKKSDPVYRRFVEAYGHRKEEPEMTKQIATELIAHLKSTTNDNFETPLTDEGKRQAFETGQKLRQQLIVPDTVFVSPHVRAIETFDLIKKGWPEVRCSNVIEDERIREQERGLYLNFNDWKIFTVFYPEQEDLMSAQGHYWYRYPQGENMPDVRLRIGSWINSLGEQANVLAVTHHIPILAIRANLENIKWNELIEIDNKNTPINCGVTSYTNRINVGNTGVLSLDTYNQKLY